MKKLFCLLTVCGIFVVPFVGCGDKAKTEVKDKAEV
jgi:hypothetical protein